MQRNLKFYKIKQTQKSCEDTHFEDMIHEQAINKYTVLIKLILTLDDVFVVYVVREETIQPSGGGILVST